MRKHILSVLTALLMAAVLQAQQTTGWSLQQCVDYALKNNIQIQQSDINVKLSELSLMQSKANALPNLNGNFSHTYNYGRTIDRFTNQFADDRVLSQNFYLSTNIIVFQGLQNWNTIRQNLFALNASRYQVDKMRNDISLNVATAFLQVLYAQENDENARKQVALTREQVKRTEKLVEVGSLAKGNLLDMQSQLAQDELTQVNAGNSLNMAYLTLIQLMRLDSSAGFAIERPVLPAPTENILSLSPDQIYALSVTGQPGVKSAEMSYKSADKAVDVAWSGVSPSVVLSGAYGTGYSGASKQITDANWNGGYDTTGVTSGGQYTLVPHLDYSFETIPFSEQLDNNLNKSIGIQVSVPIFNRMQVYTSVKRAELQRENSRLTLEQTKDQLRRDIQQAHADAVAALTRFKASEKALSAMEESFKYTDQKFNVGALNALEYNTAKAQLNRTQSDLLQARYDYIFKLKVLDYYQGKPIIF